MKTPSTILAAISALILLPSCATKSEPGNAEPDSPKKQSAHIVGRIASISSDRTFVLIQAYGSWNIPTGTILISQGSEGRTANLRVTGEKLGQYAAADLQSGNLIAGDAVIHRPALTKTENHLRQTDPEPEAELETSPESPTPPVQQTEQ